MSPARLIASFGGIGLLPGPQGTWGSAAALLPGLALLALSPWALLAGAVAVTLAGWWAVTAADAGDDPGWVVVDEVAGQWIALLPLAVPSWQGALIAFAAFRAADILKPGPIGAVDRRGDALGVMGDDVLAGMLAALVLWGVIAALPGMVP